MNKIIACLFLPLTILTSTAYAADFDAGLVAYKKNDYATAIQEWRPLANQGDVDAQLSLGAMYENGRGMPQDEKEAVRWYRLAAAQGNAPSQFNLGLMYANGRGVLQDDKEAVKWLRLAAVQGGPMRSTTSG